MTTSSVEYYYLLLDAINLAYKAHEGQVRKDGITPYIFHPLTVMLHCQSYKAKIVAVLHDVVEDTAITASDVKKKFGAEICDAVVLLTKTAKENYRDYIERISHNKLATEVKIRDMEHNLTGMEFISSDKEREYLKNKYHKSLSYLGDYR
jgi:(p)ppGpp synthase/HD superfamily hydrolase